LTEDSFTLPYSVALEYMCLSKAISRFTEAECLYSRFNNQLKNQD